MFFQSLLPSFNLNNIAAGQQQQQPEVAGEAAAAAPALLGFPQQDPNARGEAEG